MPCLVKEVALAGVDPHQLVSLFHHDCQRQAEDKTFENGFGNELGY